MEGAEQLKESLQKELSGEDLDYGKVLELANKLSRLDPDIVRFSVDASHISRLGMELVAKQETAVAELVKNAFDADADTVDLIFRAVSHSGGVLEIFDNGLGMSREQLINGFMRISTRDKENFPVSPKYKRQRAGRKGIGRFAAQRLGTRLTLKTQVENAPNCLTLEINWEDFDAGADLAQISNTIKQCDPLRHAGTLLIIEHLRDSWSEAQIKRAFRYISGLLQPFPLGKKDKEKPYDPGFQAAFYLDADGDLHPIASEEQSILAHAVATISGGVDEDGVPSITLKSERPNLRIDRPIVELEPKLKPRNAGDIDFSLLRGIKFTAKYFIQDELPTGTRSAVREVLNRSGGIRLYRNGFRVLPYGESYDDWLGLQRSSALREVLPPHHNTNFLGFVEIHDPNGELFEETSSREGLVENGPFLQLQDFIYRALMSGIIEIARLRKRKIFSSDKPITKEEAGAEVTSPSDEALGMVGRIVELAEEEGAPASTSPENAEPESAGVADVRAGDTDSEEREVGKPAAIQYAIDSVLALGKRAQELLEENGMLRVLASLGLTIGEFTHEVRHALAALTASLRLSETADPAVEENMALLKSYVQYFDDAVTDNAQRVLVAQEIRDVVNDFSKVVQPTMDRQGVKMSIICEEWDLFVRPMHRSEWASILLNLFTNALKAIHRAGSKGLIEVNAKRANDFIIVTFSDNGDGIPKENYSRVFEPFFTTSIPASALAHDSDKLVGTGLGLKIVRDIVESSGGEIYVVNPKEGFSTTIHLEIPAASDEEVGDDRY